ncbi:hypothetical protein Tco_0600084 [Tanacetum coccineum]|uniref:Xylulose kinase-1 n=1 Tax=Tanacetum coccineum TaxID=301880 RepID=A0ABQ4WAT4_9ASTR
MANMDFCDKHNMVAFLQKPTGSEEFHQIVDFLAGSHIRYALTTNLTIYVSLIEQFWQTATVETVNDGEQQITVTVDGQTIAITEAFVRRHLQFADADGEHIPLFDSMLIHDQPSQGEGPTLRRKARMVISDDEEDLVSDDPSKQGRMTETEYEEVDTAEEILSTDERIAQKLNEEEMAKDEAEKKTGKDIF